MSDGRMSAKIRNGGSVSLIHKRFGHASSREGSIWSDGFPIENPGIRNMATLVLPLASGQPQQVWYALTRLEKMPKTPTI